MSDIITLAFAGSGETTEANVRELLNDFLGFGPEDENGWPAPSDKQIHLVFPASETHVNDNLQKVVDWSEYADLPYQVVTDDSIEDSPLVRESEGEMHIGSLSLNKYLVKYLVDDRDNSYLVLLWGEEGDANCQELMDLADADGVKVLDLTQGMNDLVFIEAEEATDVPDDDEGGPAVLEPSAPIVDIPLEESDQPLEEFDPVSVIAEIPELIEDEPQTGFVDAKRARKAREDADEAQSLIKPNTDHLETDRLQEMQDSITTILDRLGKIEAQLGVIGEPEKPKRGRPRTKNV